MVANNRRNFSFSTLWYPIIFILLSILLFTSAQEIFIVSNFFRFDIDPLRITKVDNVAKYVDIEFHPESELVFAATFCYRSIPVSTDQENGKVHCPYDSQGPATDDPWP